ncbi:MAG: hypothetical protein EP343_22840 [Deltaproteobacteria bacterium]|nr:MAG: hypothetical protein EP343_22840 [Deltaproteobacteria bacterium]
MSTPPTFNPTMAYRVVLETDTTPQARLAIGPTYEDGSVEFFDTNRVRAVVGAVTGNAAPPNQDAIAFTQEDGTSLRFEPLTLERFREIADKIEGTPDFQSTEELQSFYRDFAGI